jgi:inosose dehydratase
VRRLAGNAPVSFGVYGQPIETISDLPERMLDAVEEAGYQGCELGPAGFLGSPDETAARFAARGLAAIGAYAAVHFTASDEVVARDLGRIEQSCRELVACGGGLVILADEGSDALLSNPARPRDDRDLALDDAGWQRLGERAARAVELARSHGLEVSFHPHISTYVESPWEIERLLELTDVGLTIDTGHLQLAGGDPIECLRAWRDRVDHVHLKDVRLRVLQDARARGATDFDAWWGGVCVPFGTGDVDLSGFLGELASGGYDGWLVVEQDRAPLATLDDLRAAAREQRENLEWLDRQLAMTGA